MDKPKTKQQLIAENQKLRSAVFELHWMARRYADGRRTYAATTLNEQTRILLGLNVVLDAPDGILWARDGGGRSFDNLTAAEATPGTPEAKGEHGVKGKQAH